MSTSYNFPSYTSCPEPARKDSLGPSIPKRFEGYGLLSGPSPTTADVPPPTVYTPTMSEGRWGYRVCPYFIACHRGSKTHCDHAKPYVTQTVTIYCPVQTAMGENSMVDLLEVDRHE